MWPWSIYKNIFPRYLIFTTGLDSKRLKDVILELYNITCTLPDKNMTSAQIFLKVFIYTRGEFPIM
jgi:hypothetical protein